MFDLFEKKWIDIFWVDTRVIETFKPNNVKEE